MGDEKRQYSEFLDGELDEYGALVSNLARR
jgi:hypothetical protein